VGELGSGFNSRFLQKRDHLLALHRREVVEKFVDGGAAFEAIGEIFTGTRVPANTGVPLRISGLRTTAELMRATCAKSAALSTQVCALTMDDRDRLRFILQSVLLKSAPPYTASTFWDGSRSCI
jgi:hypothetical protein